MCWAEQTSSNEVEKAIVQALDWEVVDCVAERALTAIHCGTQDKRLKANWGKLTEKARSVQSAVLTPTRKDHDQLRERAGPLETLGARLNSNYSTTLTGGKQLL